MRTRPVVVALVLAVAATLMGACGSSDTTPSAPAPPVTTASPSTTAAPETTAAAPTTTAAEPADATLLAAGDISSCSSDGDEATASLLDARPRGTVAVLGDSVYDRGTPKEFADCYAPTWGRHKERTRPAPGNHEYGSPGAAGYYGYFGAAAGDPAKGYYSYDLGAWHIVAINSNCGEVSCAAGSAQERWLRADLAAHPATCTLAYWHHPRFSSGAGHGSQPQMAPIWSTLHELGADVVLAGHDHNYERFAPLDATGDPDPARGIRSFVVGTGGRSHYGFRSRLAGSEVRNSDTYGILELTLRPSGYDWEFVPISGWTFTDSGAGVCH